MSKHFQVESQMSLSGSNADNRILVKPSELGAAIAFLYNEIASKTGGTATSGPALNEKAKKALSIAADALLSNKGKSLVVSASNNVAEQTLIHAINQLLGNIGLTVNFSNASYQRQGNDLQLSELINEMNAGSVDALFVWNSILAMISQWQIDLRVVWKKLP